MVWSLTPNQFVVEHLQDLAPASMVDLAGGEGRNALWFAKRGWHSENVEISQVALEKFQIRAEREGVSQLVRSTLADATTAKFQLKAELLVIAYLQTPIADLVKSLSNAVAQLAVGATVFGVWHAKRNLLDGFGGPPVAEFLPSPQELEAWGKDSNLKSLEVFEVERIVEKDSLKHVAIDVILKGQVPKS